MPDPTARVRLARTGLELTRMGFGAAAIAGLYAPVSEEVAAGTLKAAWSLGLRYFDTAPLYGLGISEQRLGRFLKTRQPGEYVVSTKVGRLLRKGVPHHPTEFDPEGRPFFPVGSEFGVVFDYSYDGFMRSFEESLARLGIPGVDILFIHDPDAGGRSVREVMREGYRALVDLKEQGLIKAIGVGMNDASWLAEFALEGDFDVFLVAGRYTLLDQSALEVLLPRCAERGIGVVIGGVYNSGILADPRPGATYDYLPAPRDILDRAQKIRAVADRYGVPLKAAAIQFPLGHPAVVSVLSGARTPDELRENAAMFRRPIPQEFWAALVARGLLPENVPVPKAEG